MKLRDILNEVLSEAPHNMSKKDAKILSRLLIRMSVESVIPHKDVLFVNYTNYRDRKKIIKAVSKLYSYDDDGRMTNAPRGIQGVGGTNWIAFKSRHNESVNEVESEDDTEFTVKLSHLLKKHVSKGGEVEEPVNEATDKFYIDRLVDTFKRFKLDTSRYEIMMDSSSGSGSKIPVLRPKGGFGEGAIIDDSKKGYIEIRGSKRSRPIPGKSKFDNIDDAMVAATKYVDSIKESKLNEMDINDPILVAIRARQTALKKKAALPKVKKISTKQYYKLMDMESDIIDQMKDAAKEYEQLDSEMNQDAGQKGSNWTDADANRYGGDLNKLQTRIEKLAKEKLKVKKAIMNYRIN